MKILYKVRDIQEIFNFNPDKIRYYDETINEEDCVYAHGDDYQEIYEWFAQNEEKEIVTFKCSIEEGKIVFDIEICDEWNPRYEEAKT